MRLGRPLQLGDAFTGGHKRERDRFGPEPVQSLGLLLGQLSAQGGFNQSLRRRSLCLPWPHHCLDTSAWTLAQVAYFNIFRPRLALQTADLLPLFKWMPLAPGFGASARVAEEAT